MAWKNKKQNEKEYMSVQEMRLKMHINKYKVDRFWEPDPSKFNGKTDVFKTLKIC